MLNDKTVLHPGNTASLTGSLQEIMTATNPGMFDRREYYKEKGVYYELRATTLQITSFRTNPVKDLLYRLGEVYTTSLPAKESGIVSAMILGDKSLLDIDIRQLYQESGIGHLLAISGLHVSILCMALIRFFKHTGISERIFIPAGIGLVLAYGQMTDFSISTSRAVIMMILLLAADLFERTYDGKNSLAIAAVIILLQKPFALFSCSFPWQGSISLSRFWYRSGPAIPGKSTAEDVRDIFPSASFAPTIPGSVQEYFLSDRERRPPPGCF